MFDIVSREALWQTLTLCDLSGKLSNYMKRVDDVSQEFVRIRADENDSFKIHGSVRKVCIMSPWLFNMYSI